MNRSGETPRARYGGASDDRLLAASVVILIAVLTIAGLIWLAQGLRQWHMRDLERQGALVGDLLAHDVASLDPTALAARFDRVATDERVHGVMLCDGGSTVALSRGIRGWLDCGDGPVRAAAGSEASIVAIAGRDELLLSPRRLPGGRVLVVVQDRTFIGERVQNVTRVVAAIALAFAALAGLGFLLLSRRIRARSRRRMADMLRRLVKGEKAPENMPEELAGLVRDLDESVASRRRAKADPAESGPARLRRLVEERMPDTRLVLIANREPYMHVRDGGRVVVQRPASGLVTGVEPLLRACGGVWIGHGSGNADRDHADAKGRLAVPPEAPEYVLRRVWLTRKEEEGYYYGFSNEGLWPLCHIAHARPTFRQSDWDAYQEVNSRFAAVAAEEAGERGLVLVQDYHFARVPAELRKLSPGVLISLFWHIPWPNHEVVNICPWKEALLDGMLGADIIGFHTRYHCLNFLETVQRYMEARVDLETMSVEYKGRTTRVKPYPISVEWPYPAKSEEEGAARRRQLGLEGVFTFAGVDRADYTKGLLERVAAVGALLEEHPELVGRFQMVQLAAPSRTHIKRYRDLISEVEEAVTAVNRRWGVDGWEPIRFELRSADVDEVRTLYALADCAVVTPLHDGMNLVAKEYVASREDEQGVLILSTFAGASKELDGALVVNPYHTSEVAEAMYRAYTMDPGEKQARMRSMRAAVARNTIYDWSASLLRDMADLWRRDHERGWPRAHETVAGQENS